jgi:hypothetical protein
MEMFWTKHVEKHKTHISCPITFFPKIVHFLYDVKNIVAPGWPPVTMWRMRFARWIPKATDTHSECEIFLLSISTIGT